MNRIKKTAAALAAVALLGVACGDAAAPATSDPVAAPAADGAVAVRQFAFDEATITITAGEAVTWTNEDRILHTVTAGSPDAPQPDLFDRPLDGAGATTTIRFDEPGSYDYFCSRHPHMRGVIVVQEGA